MPLTTTNEEPEEIEDECRECGQTFYESELSWEGNCWDCQMKVDEEMEEYEEEQEEG